MRNPSPNFRSGYIAIVGWPNVGKSTLLNSFLGAKLSIVSSKPQTTRDAILGILNEGDAQLIFVDTPGWIKPNSPFQALLKRNVVRAVHDDADVLLWLLEPQQLSPEQLDFGNALIRTGKHMVMAINKIDAVSQKETLNLLKGDVQNAFGAALPVFPISAKLEQGVSDLKAHLLSALPLSPPYFPTDQITDRWERFYAAELIRENLFHLYREEVPHASLVTITDFLERPGQKDHVHATITVESEGQKKILIGQKGSAIKTLGEKSRHAIETMLGRPVHLKLLVKVRKNWRKDVNFIKQMTSEGHQG